MFRTIFKQQRLLILKRRLHDSKLPTVEPSLSIQEKYVGVESPKKADHASKKPSDKIFQINSKDEYDDEYICYYNRED